MIREFLNNLLESEDALDKLILVIITVCIQNSWLGLTEGMASNTSEFQQALRYHLGALLTKLLALSFICPLTGLSCQSVCLEGEGGHGDGGRGQAGGGL